MQAKALREGKSKVLYETADPTEIIQYFKDDATAFNAQKKGQIRDKGVVNCAVSSWIFQRLEKAGIPTHFLRKVSDREMLCRRVEIIPVEVVVRNRAAGSIVTRLGVSKGTAFASPLVEFFYKSDALGDPLIGETHILHFGWATESEIRHLSEQAHAVNAFLREWMQDRMGLELIDFKLEFGRMPDGRVVLADEITPDGCRLWDIKTGQPMDKDRFRQDLGGVEDAYREVLRRFEEACQTI